MQDDLVARLRVNDAEIYLPILGQAADRIEALEADKARLMALLQLAISALTEAREALHFHYVEWDGEPEDAVPLQLARAKCDQAISVLKENPNG